MTSRNENRKDSIRTVFVNQRVDVITDVMITDSITERDLTNKDSSAETDNRGAKDEQGDMSTMVTVVLPSHRHLLTICGLQL